MRSDSFIKLSLLLSFIPLFAINPHIPHFLCQIIRMFVRLSNYEHDIVSIPIVLFTHVYYTPMKIYSLYLVTLIEKDDTYGYDSASP